MLLAYIDEIGEPGAYVSKEHPRFNTNPVFGYAGFVIPERTARRFGRHFTEEKRRQFANELVGIEHPGRWERKGSDIFTPDAWASYRSQIRTFRGLVRTLGNLGGKVFYYADQKEKGTEKQVRLDRDERETRAMQETVNRLCRYAAGQDSNLLIMMDQINEKQRAAHVSASYAHIFSRSKEFPEMEAAVEPPMHIDSALSSNIQFADWVATAVSRAIDYQLEPQSRYGWIPDALAGHMRHQLTHESKLHLWQSSISDLHHSEVFYRERPVLTRVASGLMSEESLAKLEKVKHATVRRK